MCEKKHEIQLCSCSNRDNENIYFNESMNFKLAIKWTLSRFIRQEWVGMDGILIEPVDEFSMRFTADFFSNEMNTKNCFDFEYLPSEGDTIVFESIIVDKMNYKHSREKKTISLIFRDKLWVIDFYDSFYNTTQTINKGYLKLLN